MVTAGCNGHSQDEGATRVSRLTELLRQARKADPQLGRDLESEVTALLKRRTFGLVFERHQPEAVDLPGRPVRRGDKVRILPPRGEVKAGDNRLWRVERIERLNGERVGHLKELGSNTPATQLIAAEDLVVVAEFSDRIYPGLVETGRIERGGTDKPFHTVINAENFHALEMLTYTHRHSVDVIYIDPPYNTGARDWKYNNDYVASDDDYRHSKWLAFMGRRIEVARELLNPADGVLVVTIDEKEVHRLALLLEQTLPEAKIQMVSITINPRGVARGREFARVNEFAFFCFLGNAGPSLTDDDLLSAEDQAPDLAVRWERLIKGSNNARRVDRPNLFYPVWIDPERAAIVEVGEALPLSADRRSVPARPGLIPVWPLARDGSEKRWQNSPETLRDLASRGMAKVGAYDAKNDRWSLSYLNRGQRERIERGEIAVRGKDDNGVLELELVSAPGRAGMTVWNRQRHSAGYYGSGIVRALLPGRTFPFPKSLYAVEDALRFVVKDKPEAIVLDFFAGSGTTAHAVMRLNKQDGGKRRCISITNNEVSAEEQKGLRERGLRPGDPEWEAQGICDYITKPRITAAITGRTPEGAAIKGDYKFVGESPMADGFEENAAFFTLTYESPLAVRHHRAFDRIAPMLWMRAGARGRMIEDLGDAGWNVAETYGVLENLDQARQFVKEVANGFDVRTAFVVTDDESAFQMVCRDLPSRVLPVRLYESYLQNFELRGGH